jgi:acetyl esterase/lipase
MTQAVFPVEVRNDVTYATHDNTELQGDLYRPGTEGKYPAIVAVHGGSWQGGRRSNHRYWGEYLAARGYVVFAISYRLSKPDRKSYSAAVHDVRAAVQFIKQSGVALGADPQRVALLGDSAGAHLAALVALAGDPAVFAGSYRDDPLYGVSTKVKVLVGNYGIYDLAAYWRSELTTAPAGPTVARFLGASLSNDRRVYFDASPLSYVTVENTALAVLLAYGTHDDVADHVVQSEAFLRALKQAQFVARTVVIPAAGHFWASEPIDASWSSSSRLAPRLVRFLEERL